MAFQDNQIIQTSIPMEQPNQATSGIIQSLPASQSLNALRGRWMGSTNAANRPPVTEQRQGRGGRPPVFTPEARPRQERAAQAAQQHRTGVPTRSQQQGQGTPNFFNVSTQGRRNRGGY